MERVLKCIRQSRRAKDLKQETIAHALGISQAAYSQLENGQVNLSAKQLIQLFHLLDISYDEAIPKDWGELQAFQNEK